MLNFLLIIFILVLLVGVFFIIKNFMENKKEEGLSTILSTTGIELIICSFGKIEDKILPALIMIFNNLKVEQAMKVVDDASRTNYVQLGVGFILLCLGLGFKIYIKNKIYILNINGYFDTRIENHYDDIKLSAFEFKERVIDFIRIYKNGINIETVKNIIDEIKEKVTPFINESREFKRGYTGIAPIPFIIYVGTMFKRERIDEYYEYDKKFTEKYYKLAKRHFLKKYPLLKLITPIENVNKSATEIVVAISITTDITNSDLSQFDGKEIIKLSVDKPSDNIIKFQEQLRQYVNLIYETINNPTKSLSNLKRIHLVYSGQSCLALEIGKLIDDNRMPQIINYHFTNQSACRYSWGIIINGPEKGKMIDFSN